MATIVTGELVEANRWGPAEQRESISAIVFSVDILPCYRSTLQLADYLQIDNYTFLLSPTNLQQTNKQTCVSSQQSLAPSSLWPWPRQLRSRRRLAK